MKYARHVAALFTILLLMLLGTKLARVRTARCARNFAASQVVVMTDGTATRQHRAEPQQQRKMWDGRRYIPPRRVRCREERRVAARGDYSEFLDDLRRAFNDTLRDRSMVRSYNFLLSTFHERVRSGGVASNGFWAEFGVWRGDSLSMAETTLLTPAAREVFRGPIAGFDSWEGLPQDWRSGYLKAYFGQPGTINGTRNLLYEKVRARISPKIELHRGWFQETITNFLLAYPDIPASLIHHDGDLFLSATITLQMMNSRIVPGTLMEFDELFCYPGWEQHEALALYLWMHSTDAEVCAIATRSPFFMFKSGAVWIKARGKRKAHWAYRECHAHDQSALLQVIKRGWT